MDRAALRYTAFYCEENVWHLAADPRLPAGERFAVFVSNAERCCPMWSQRASEAPDVPVVWDYHVVLLLREPGRPVDVWDLDTRLALPVPLERWLAATFPFAGAIAPRYEPRFRVVEAEALRRTFASDRSHMRKGSRWRAKPPTWPLIATETEVMNLDRFLDVEDAWIGELCDLEGLVARFLAPGDGGPGDLGR